MDLIQTFLTVQTNIRLYHWSTPLYNQHIVSGQLYEKMDSLIDKFIETYLGKYPIVFQKSKLKIDQFDNEETFHVMLTQFKHFLQIDVDLLLKSKHNNDLKNIRDDIIGEVNRFIFLLKLK